MSGGGRLRLAVKYPELFSAVTSYGAGDGLFGLNVEFQELLKRMNSPVDWVPVPGVAHDAKGLYDRAGLESLRFFAMGK